MTNGTLYPKATLEEYGYHEYKALKLIWRIVRILLVLFTIAMLYLAVFVIAIQSFNSSDSTTEFKGFTFNNYLTMFTSKPSLNKHLYGFYYCNPNCCRIGNLSSNRYFLFTSKTEIKSYAIE